MLKENADNLLRSVIFENWLFISIWICCHLIKLPFYQVTILSSHHFIKSPVYQVTILSSYHLKLIQTSHHLDQIWEFHLKCMAFINHLHCGLILIWKYSPFRKNVRYVTQKTFQMVMIRSDLPSLSVHSRLLHSKCEIKLIFIFQQFSVPLHLL